MMMMWPGSEVDAVVQLFEKRLASACVRPCASVGQCTSSARSYCVNTSLKTLLNKCLLLLLLCHTGS
jgi:hypothetical protein